MLSVLQNPYSICVWYHKYVVCDVVIFYDLIYNTCKTYISLSCIPNKDYKEKRKADLLNFLVVQGAGFLYPFNLNCCKYFKIFYGCNKVCFCRQLLRLLTIYLRILIHPTFPSSVKFLCLAVSYNLGVDKIKPRDNKYFSPMIGLTEPCKTLFTNFFQK